MRLLSDGRYNDKTNISETNSDRKLSNNHENRHTVVMMIISPNSRAHKIKKERGDEKEEYGGVCG